MLNRLISATAIGLALLAMPTAGFAQANRGSTTQGAFGQTTLGGTSGATPQGLGSGMTQGMGGNATQGGSGTNNNMSMSNGQFGVATEAMGMQNLQRGGQTGFVGLSASNVQNFLSSGQGGALGGRGGAQSFNMLTQLMSQSRRNQFNQQQAQRGQRGGTQAQSQFRVPMRLGFAPPSIRPEGINEYSTRLTKIPGMSQLGPIRATLEGRTAVLRGMVATEADRQLAEGLAMLEPEVQAVRNELVVGSPGTTGEALPPPVP